MSKTGRIIGGTLAALSLVVLLQGCVSRATYLRKVDEYNMVNERRVAAEVALTRLQNNSVNSVNASDLVALQKERDALIAQLRGDRGKLKGAFDRINQLNNAIANLQKEKDGLAGQLTQMTAKEKELIQRLKEIGIMNAKIVDGMVQFNLSSDLLFNSGSATLKGGMKKTLADLAVILQERAERVRIDGHTDNVPLVKTLRRWEDNLGLSTARALSVSRFLRTKGVQQNALYVAGYGEFRPLDEANKDTKAGRQQNRRVEIFIAPKKSTG